MTPRIAVVQHGDAREARRLRAAGLPEPYAGMHYRQGFRDGWLAGRPHLIVSLDAPAYSECHGDGLLIGLPEPSASAALPRTATEFRWARRIVHELNRFRPTHFLLRTGSLRGAVLLRAAVRQRWQTLAMFAGFFPTRRLYDRLLTSSLVRLLNHPLVFAVGNHRWPATDSMIEAGVNPSKAIAWDYPSERDPADSPVKQFSGGRIELVYAGAMVRPKGVDEAIDAVADLCRKGRDVRLTLCGDGRDLSMFRRKAAGLGDRASILGRVGNDEVVRQMAAATFVVVPTRHDFPEGFPLTLTEALTTRTPVLASDHPVFTRALADGEGIRYFPARDSAALARLIEEVSRDPLAYADLSLRTEGAFEKLRCRTRFDEVVTRWLA